MPVQRHHEQKVSYYQDKHWEGDQPVVENSLQYKAKIDNLEHPNDKVLKASMK